MYPYITPTVERRLEPVLKIAMRADTATPIKSG